MHCRFQGSQGSGVAASGYGPREFFGPSVCLGLVMACFEIIFHIANGVQMASAVFSLNSSIMRILKPVFFFYIVNTHSDQ